MDFSFLYVFPSLQGNIFQRSPSCSFQITVSPDVARYTTLYLFHLPAPLDPMQKILFSHNFLTHHTRPFHDISFRKFLLLSGSPSHLTVHIHDTTDYCYIPYTNHLSQEGNAYVPAIFHIPQKHAPDDP